MNWPRIEGIRTERLILEPLTLTHAPDMVHVLGDRSTYVFTGGEPPSLAELQHRYARQVAGHSPDRKQWWLNWIVRTTSQPVGFVQATVEQHAPGLVTDLAWVLGPQAQRQGYAVGPGGAAPA